jgi:hypothetical protein
VDVTDGEEAARHDGWRGAWRGRRRDRVCGGVYGVGRCEKRVHRGVNEVREAISLSLFHLVTGIMLPAR